MRRFLAPLIALLLFATLAFVACDDNGGSGETPTPQLPTEAPPTATVPPVTEDPTEAVAGACSAAALNVALVEQPELPAEAAQMREQIFDAALACDYDTLEELALADGETFSYSFGEKGESEPAAYWRNAEEQGEGVLAALVNILNMPPVEIDGALAWPWAYTLDFANLSEDDRAMLEQYFSAEEIADWEAFGGYIGYRAIITRQLEDGGWTAFIAGD